MIQNPEVEFCTKVGSNEETVLFIQSLTWCSQIHMSAFLWTSKNGTEVYLKVCMNNVSFELNKQELKEMGRD